MGREDQGSELSAPPHPAPHQLCAGHNPATHICLVPQSWDAEGFQKVTATQQQDPHNKIIILFLGAACMLVLVAVSRITLQF